MHGSISGGKMSDLSIKLFGCIFGSKYGSVFLGVWETTERVKIDLMETTIFSDFKTKCGQSICSRISYLYIVSGGNTDGMARVLYSGGRHDIF